MSAEDNKTIDIEFTATFVIEDAIDEESLRATWNGDLSKKRDC